MSELDDKLASWRTATEPVSAPPDVLAHLHHAVETAPLTPPRGGFGSGGVSGGALGWIVIALVIVSAFLLPPALRRLFSVPPPPPPVISSQPSVGVPVASPLPAQLTHQVSATQSHAESVSGSYLMTPGERYAIDVAARIPAYPFDAVTVDGQRVALEKMRGKVVLIDFWDDGCGFCWDGVPQLVQMKRDFPNVAFVSFAANTEEELRNLPKTRHFPLPVVADPESMVASNYGVMGYPTYVVVDAFGRRVPLLQVAHEDRYEKVRRALRLAARQGPPQPLPREPSWFEGPCEVHGQATVGADHSPASTGAVGLLATPGGPYRWVRIGSHGEFVFTNLPCEAFTVTGYSRRPSDQPRAEAHPAAGEPANVELHFDAEPWSRPAPPARKPLSPKRP